MSFRNRCIVPGANGLVNLSIPVMGGRNVRGNSKDVRIDNTSRWQSIHWRTIYSAYNRSPWFEFFRDELQHLYEKKYEFLWDWNLEAFNWTIEKLGVKVDITYTEENSETYSPEKFMDWGDRVLPKNYQNFTNQVPVYRQVFEEKLGFLPNLSILDLLFCEGRNAAAILKVEG